MTTLNPFGVFSVSEISAAINVLPNRYGLINQRNVFPVKAINNTTVTIEEKNGSLALLVSGVQGQPATQNEKGKRNVRTFKVPNFTHEDLILPQDVIGLRGFNTGEQMAIADLLNDSLQGCKDKHNITLEYLRMGALKGQIVDGAGTLIADLFAEYGITKKSIDFVLGTATTDVRGKCMELVRWIEDNLRGEMNDGVDALVSPEFFDKLTGHPKVKEAYANYQEASQRLGGDMRKGFTFGGVTFIEYRAQAANSSGTLQRFINAGMGHAYPTGTANTFKTFASPADFNETVGTAGQLYYAKVEDRKFNRGFDVHTQSNPLPLCMRPAVLVECTSSN